MRSPSEGYRKTGKNKSSTGKLRREVLRTREREVEVKRKRGERSRERKEEKRKRKACKGSMERGQTKSEREG